MLDAVLIYNPTAGRRRQQALVELLLPALGAGGWRAEPAATAAPGDAGRLAEEAAAAGASAVFVLGGDGTVREAACGLVEVERAGRPAPPLGILPAGTANVLARALGLPRSPLAAARRLGRSGSGGSGGAAPSQRRLDVGLCGDTPFLMMVSSGLDAHLLARLDTRWKARWGRAGILVQGIGEWWRYGYPELAVAADGEPPEPAGFAAVCNIPLYAGGFALAPGARWDDRRLDLVLHRRRGRLPTLGFALAVAGGLPPAAGGAAARRVAEVTLDGRPGTCLQVDGDVCAEALPARVRLAAETVPVLVPATD